MKQVFQIAYQSTGLGSWLVLGLILVPVVLIVGWAVYSARNVRFELSDGSLRIRGDLYGRTIPLSDLDLAGARVLDLRTDTDHRLRWRTNGLGLPSYKSGWFRLRNGEKALAFVSDPSQVAYIPTKKGYALMLSVRNGPEFMAALEGGAR